MEMEKAIKIGQYMCAGYVMILSMLDYRRRKLPIWILSLGGIAAFGYQMLYRILPWGVIVFGVAVGAVFLIISKMTKEAFGYGDSILITILGIFLGGWDLLILLAVSFFLSSLVAMGVLVRHHFQRTTAFPFVPFLGCGYVILLLAGGL